MGDKVDNTQHWPSNASEITLVDENLPYEKYINDNDESLNRYQQSFKTDLESQNELDTEPEGPSKSWVHLTTPLLPSQLSNPSGLKSNLREEIQRLQKDNAYLRLRESRLKSQIEEMRPLFNIGQDIRNRKLTKDKTNPDPQEVQNGNHSAHHADPLADASLHLRTREFPREDPELFIGLYGVTWETVWEMRDCPAFIEMLSWYGTLNSWAWEDYGTFGETYFYEVWLATVGKWYEGGLEKDLKLLRRDLGEGKWARDLIELQAIFGREVAFKLKKAGDGCASCHTRNDVFEDAFNLRGYQNIRIFKGR